MELLEKYDKSTAKHIIDIGIFNYEKCLEYNLKNVTVSSLSKWNNEEELNKTKESNKKLKQEIEKLNNSLYSIRENEREKGEKNIEYFKEQLKNTNEEKKKLLDLYKQNVEIEVHDKTLNLQQQIEDLKSKNDYYYKLYVDTSKGKNYEEELYPNMLDYNDKYLNSIWTITHVGSVLSEKTDFHFNRKDLNLTILLDTKNNLSTNPVANTQNFVRDVTKKETNAIGGIMLANGNICNKKNFELNKINDKYLVYVSEFKRDNIAYIFSLLDMIVDFSRVKESGLDKNILKKILKQNYKNEQTNLENLEKNKKSILKNIQSIIEDYNIYFKEDIEMEIKNEEVNSSSARVKEKTSEEIINFDEMEKEKEVIGKRSKYYLIYEEKGVNKVQYFINNYQRNRKLKSLDKKKTSENIIVIT
tara:strand:- start:299 stop:1546 length:1248 start_codon:yes stop_codon:yes gene_type:complete